MATRSDWNPLTAQPAATVSTAVWSRLRAQIPNGLTLIRLLAVPIMVWLLLEGDVGVAFWVLVMSGLTDLVDGALARAWRVESRVGRVIDPLADKALIVTAFITLAKTGLLANWLVVIVVARDIMIVGGVLLLYTMRINVQTQPTVISKMNTATQILLLVTVMAPFGLPDALSELMPLAAPLYGLTTAVAVLTLISGGIYFIRGWRMLGGSGSPPVS